MCYTAIPGQNQGIRGASFETTLRPVVTAELKQKPVRVRKNKHFTKSAVIPSASVAQARAATPLIESMSVEFIPYAHRRRERQTSYEKGKRLAKRQHKPEWRNYEKY